MKKFMFAVAAILVVFALIGCGKEDSPPPATVTLTLNANLGTGNTLTGTLAESVNVPQNVSVTAAMLPTTGFGNSSGDVFGGWFRESATQNSAIGHAFNTNATIWAKWDPPVAAGKTRVHFEANGDGATVNPTFIDVTTDTTPTADSVTVPTPVRTATATHTFTFAGWFSVQGTSGGTEFTAGTTVTASMVLTYYARWTAVPIGTGPGNEQEDMTVRFIYQDGTIKDVPFTELGVFTFDDILNELVKAPISGTKTDTWTDNGTKVFAYWKDQNNESWEQTTAGLGSTIDIIKLTLTSVFYSTVITSDGGLERLFLENGAYAVFKFSLDGQEFQNFGSITVDYKVSEATLRQKSIRGARALGVFYAADFDPDVTDDVKSVFGPVAVGDAPQVKDAGVDDNGTRYVKLGGWANNVHILNNRVTGGSWVDFNYGTAPTPDTWFTITYDITGTAAHAQWCNGGFPAKPDDDYSGDIYIALGITGGYGAKNVPAAGGIEQIVKNITLVPKATATTATPVVSAGSGFPEPLFVTYVDDVVFSYRGAASGQIVIPPAPKSCDCTDKNHVCECGLAGCTCKPHVEGLEPVETLNPILTSFGSTKNTDDVEVLTIAGNKGTFKLGAEDYNTPGKFSGGGIVIRLPTATGAEWNDYDWVEVTFTLTVRETPSNGQTQVLVSSAGQPFANGLTGVLRNGVALTSNWTDWGGVGTHEIVILIPTTNDLKGEAAAPAVHLRLNNNGAADVPRDADITVTKIKLIPAEE